MKKRTIISQSAVKKTKVIKKAKQDGAKKTIIGYASGSSKA